MPYELDLQNKYLPAADNILGQGQGPVMSPDLQSAIALAPPRAPTQDELIAAGVAAPLDLAAPRPVTPEELQAQAPEEIYQVVPPTSGQDFAGAVAKHKARKAPSAAQSKKEIRKADAKAAETEDALEAAKKLEFEAVKNKGLLLEHENMRMQVAQDHERVEKERQAAEDQRVRDALIQQRDASNAAANAAIERDAKMGVDPRRIYKNADGSENWGAHVLSGLALIMGNIGSALLGEGGDTSVLDNINRTIDRDIEAQKIDIAQAGEDALAKRTQYKESLDALKDHELVALNNQKLIVQTYLKKYDEIARGFKSKTAIANGDQVRAGILTKYEEIDAKFQKRAADRDQQEFNNRIALRRVRVEERSMALQESKSLLTDGKGGKQLPAGVVQKIGGLKTAEKMLHTLGEEWDAKTGWFSGLTQYFPNTDANRYNSRRAVAAQVIGSILEGGKLTESDYERYYNALPSPGDWSGDKDYSIEAIRDLVRSQREGESSALGTAGYNTEGLGAQAAPSYAQPAGGVFHGKDD